MMAATQETYQVTYLVFLRNKATSEDFVVPHNAGPNQEETVMSQLRFRYPPNRYEMFTVYTLEELKDTIATVERWPGVASKPQFQSRMPGMPAGGLKLQAVHTAFPKSPEPAKAQPEAPTAAGVQKALQADGILDRINKFRNMQTMTPASETSTPRAATETPSTGTTSESSTGFGFFERFQPESTPTRTESSFSAETPRTETSRTESVTIPAAPTASVTQAKAAPFETTPSPLSERFASRAASMTSPSSTTPTVTTPTATASTPPSVMKPSTPVASAQSAHSVIERLRALRNKQQTA